MRHRRLGAIGGKALPLLFVAVLVVAGLVAGLASAGGSSRVTNATAVQATNATASPVTHRHGTVTGPATGVLQATIAPDSALLNDGDGVATVTLADVGSTQTSISRLKAVIRVPRPARIDGFDRSKAWQCTTGPGPGDAITCRPAAAVLESSSLPPINLDVRAAGTGAARLTVHATWTQRGPGGRPAHRATNAALKVDERPPLTVHVSAVQKTVTDLVAGVPTTPTILRGTVGGRTPEPIRVRWRQACGHDPCTHVQWTTPIEGLLVDGQQPQAAFEVPNVTRPERLRFELTATDPRGSVTRFTSVRVLPDQIAHIDPNLKSVTLAGARLNANERPVTGLRLSSGDQASVSVGTSDAYQTDVNGLVSLTASVAGQRVRSVRWSVAMGPPSMLAGARRRGTTIRFRAPGVPGTYAVRMTATTAAGSFTRDEQIVVRPGGVSHAIRAIPAAVDPKEESAFCKVEKQAREHGKIEISLPAGGDFKADTNNPGGATCSGGEALGFHGGTTTLGSFKLVDLAGTITEAHGLVIERGTLVTPAFWEKKTESATDSSVHMVNGGLATQAANEGEGLRIGFQIPETTGVNVTLGIPLTGDGFGDLAGSLDINGTALSKFPIASSLPFGWKMAGISLTVLPEARRFELTATAKGPATANNTGGEISFDGTLTFDGQASVTVTASNLAVFGSAGGEKATLTASGTLTLLPGRKLDPSKPEAGGSFFPVVDVEVSAKIENYRPAANVTLSGSVTWSSGGALDVEGQLVVNVKGNDIRTTVTGSYTDTQKWKLYASLDAGEAGLTIGNPALLKLKSIEGELTREGGKLDFSVKGEATDVHVFKNVDVKTAKVAFTSACKFANEEPAAAETGTLLCLEVEADFEVKLPGAKADTPPLEVKGSGKLDFKTLKFEATGKLKPGTPFGPEALHLHDVQLSVTNAPPKAADCAAGAKEASANGVYFVVEANGKVLGLPLNVKGAYLGGEKPEYCLRATLASASLPAADKNSDELTKDAAPATPGCTHPTDPSLQELTFDYSSATQVAEFNGKFCLPSAVREKLGDVGTQQGTFNIKLSKDGFEGSASYTLEQTRWFLNALPGNTPDPTKAALGFRTLKVAVKATKTAGLSLGLDAGGEISLPAPTTATGGAGAGSRADVHLGVDVSLRPAPQLTFSVVIGGKKIDEKAPQPPCNRETPGRLTDVFGAPGFDICQLGLSGSIGADGFSLGVNARFLLPDSWSEKLGTQNASFAIGFKISASRPCVDVAIAKSDAQSNNPAIDLLNKGVIKADLAALRIAPNGCDLPGVGEIPAGFSLAFKGVMFGTPTTVDLAITRKDAGLKIDFTQETGASAIGPLKFGASRIRVLLDGAQTELEVHTSMAIGDAGGLLIDGSFKRSGSTTTFDASTCLIARIPPEGETQPCGTVRLAGAEFSGRLSFHFETGPRTIAKFTGRLTADLKVIQTDVNVRELTYDSGEGGLQTLDFEATATVKLGPASATGGVAVVYARTPGALKLTLNGTWELWGTPRGTVNRTWDLSRIEIPFTIVTPGAPLKLAFGLVRLSGDVKGALVWTPSGGFSVTTDFRALRSELCDPFDVLGCAKLGELRVNKDTGEVSGEVLGIKYGVPAADWIRGEHKAQLPSVSTDGMIVNGRWRKCIDLPAGVNARFSPPVQVVDCPEGSRHEGLPAGLQLVRRWKLDANGRVSDLAGTFCLSASGTGVFVTGCGGTTWRIDYRGRFVAADGKCMEVTGDTEANSTGARLAPCSFQPNQSWAMSGALRLNGTDLCAAPRGGQPVAFSPLVLVKCGQSTTTRTFKTNPDGRLHVTDADCITPQERNNAVLGLDANDAIIRSCHFGNLDSAPTVEFRDGNVKQAGRDECLVATDRVLGAKISFASCSAGPQRRQWDFGV